MNLYSSFMRGEPLTSTQKHSMIRWLLQYPDKFIPALERPDFPIYYRPITSITDLKSTALYDALRFLPPPREIVEHLLTRYPTQEIIAAGILAEQPDFTMTLLERFHEPVETWMVLLALETGQEDLFDRLFKRFLLSPETNSVNVRLLAETIFDTNSEYFMSYLLPYLSRHEYDASLLDEIDVIGILYNLEHPERIQHLDQLLEQGLTPNLDLLARAIEFELKDKIDLLLEYGVDPMEDPCNILISLIKSENNGLAAYFVKKTGFRIPEGLDCSESSKQLLETFALSETTFPILFTLMEWAGARFLFKDEWEDNNDLRVLLGQPVLQNMIEMNRIMNRIKEIGRGYLEYVKLKPLQSRKTESGSRVTPGEYQEALTRGREIVEKSSIVWRDFYDELMDFYTSSIQTDPLTEQERREWRKRFETMNRESEEYLVNLRRELEEYERLFSSNVYETTLQMVMSHRFQDESRRRSQRKRKYENRK